jgi:hypothetical protein
MSLPSEKNGDRKTTSGIRRKPQEPGAKSAFEVLLKSLLFKRRFIVRGPWCDVWSKTKFLYRKAKI